MRNYFMEQEKFGLRIEFGTSFLTGTSFLCKNFFLLSRIFAEKNEKLFYLTVKDKKDLEILEFLKVRCDPKSAKEVKEKLTHLILNLCRKRKKILDFVILSFEEGVSKKLVKKQVFFRKQFKRPISENEFKKIIEATQKNSFYEAKRKTLRNFNIEIVDAKIRKIVIDSKTIYNPIGISAGNVCLETINLYLSSDFYNIIKKILKRFKTGTIFFD